MSTIRSDLPAPQGIRPDAGAAKDVRAAFFRAALDQAQGVAPAKPQTPARRTDAPGRASAEPEPSTRGMRPGSLLDIRV